VISPEVLRAVSIGPAIRSLQRWRHGKAPPNPGRTDEHDYLPVVPHKAVAEVSKIGNL